MPQRNDCPKCGNRTFHQTPNGRECSRCGYDINFPGGIDGGHQCHHCGKRAVFENQGVMTCKNCGAQYS
jgi:hypothetical protein